MKRIKMTLSPGTRLIVLVTLYFIFLGARDVLGVGSLLRTNHSTVRSWFAELRVPNRPVDFHNSFITGPIERRLGNVPGVSHVHSVVMRSKIVFAFLTDSNADEARVESDLRLLVNETVLHPANGGSARFQLLVTSKPADEPLRGVKRPDPDLWSGFGPYEHLQHELVTLFGPGGVYDETMGLDRHIRGDLIVRLEPGSFKGEAQTTLGELIPGGFATELSRIENIQTTMVRDLVYRVADLEYSGSEALRVGLTPGDLARVASGEDASQASQVSHAKGTQLPTVYQARDLSSILERTLYGEGQTQIRLGDVVTVRPYHLVVSGPLGTPPSSWHVAEGQLTTRGAGPASARRPYLELVLQDRDRAPETAARVEASLKALQSSRNPFSFNVEIRDASPLQREKGLSGLLLLSLLLALIAVFLPVSVPGHRYAQSLAVSIFLFMGLATVSDLDLSIDRIASALALPVIFSFVRELPNAREGHLKTSRKLLSERMSLFLGLLTLPVIFSVTVTDVTLTWGERQHLLAFVLVALALIMSAPMLPDCPRRFLGSSESPGWSGVYRALAIGGSLFLLLTLFDSRVMSIDPPGVSFEGRLDLGELDRAELANLGDRAVRELEEMRALDLRVFGGATPLRGSEFRLMTDSSATLKIGAETLSDVLLGLDPLLVGRVTVGGSSRQQESVLVRLVDADLRTSFGGSDWPRSHPDALLARLDQGALPAKRLEGAPGAHVEAQEMVGLRLLVNAKQESTLAREIREHGQPIALIRGWGRTDAAGGARALAGAVETSIAGLPAKLGLGDDAVQVRTNLAARADAAETASRIMWICALLIFGVGALFFGSLKGGLQTFVTFLVCYGLSKPVLLAVYALTGGLFVLTTLEIQLAALLTSLALLCVWGFIAADTDASRRANLSLHLAFGPIFVQSRRMAKVLIGLWSIVLVLGLSLIPFRFFGGIMLCAIAALLLFPAWAYLLSEVEEVFHRVLLRARVQFLVRNTQTGGRDLTKGHASLVIAGIGLAGGLLAGFSQRAFAEELSDTTCRSHATYILPLMNRPMSVEPVKVDRQLTGLLASKIPCSLVLEDGSDELVAILDRARVEASYEQAVEAIKALLRNSHRRFEKVYRSSTERAGNRPVHVVSGFTEEIHGFRGVTIIHSAGSPAAEHLKFTVRTADLVKLSERISTMLAEDEVSLLESIEKKTELIPVSIEPKGLSDSAKDGDALRIRSEVYNFLVSRFDNPFPPRLLERRQFFRLAREGEEPVYHLELNVEALGSRLFASLKVSSKTEERTLWLDDDVANLVQFEEALMSGSQRALSQLEGIVDYSLIGGLAVMGDKDRYARLFGLALRQNRGVMAFTGRLRAGKSDGFESRPRSQSLLMIGASAGYQPLDWRFFNLDIGLGADAGIAQLDDDPETGEGVTEPNLLISGSGYLQLFIPLPSGLTFGFRLGAEYPLVIETADESKETSGGSFAESSEARGVLGEAMVGLGYSF